MEIIINNSSSGKTQFLSNIYRNYCFFSLSIAAKLFNDMLNETYNKLDDDDVIKIQSIVDHKVLQDFFHFFFVHSIFAIVSSHLYIPITNAMLFK